MQARTVLVVDDDVGVVEVLQQALGRLGYQADAVNDGAAAVELFRRKRHDLVITDLRMPGISGWDVIEGVRSIDAAITDADRERATTMQVRTLMKPPPLRELESLARAALEARRLGARGGESGPSSPTVFGRSAPGRGRSGSRAAGSGRLRVRAAPPSGDDDAASREGSIMRWRNVQVLRNVRSRVLWSCVALAVLAYGAFFVVMLERGAPPHF